MFVTPAAPKGTPRTGPVVRPLAVATALLAISCVRASTTEPASRSPSRTRAGPQPRTAASMSRPAPPRGSQQGGRERASSGGGQLVDLTEGQVQRRRVPDEKRPRGREGAPEADGNRDRDGTGMASLRRGNGSGDGDRDRGAAASTPSPSRVTPPIVVHSNAPDLQPPEDCRLVEQARAGLHSLQCEGHRSLVSSTAHAAGTDVLALKGFLTNLQNSGWALQRAGVESLQLGKESLNVARYEGSKGTTDRDFVVGFHTSERDHRRRFFACIVGRGAEPTGCNTSLEFLTRYARAYEVTGYEILGASTEFPKDCALRKNGVSCGNHNLTWEFVATTQGPAIHQRFVDRMLTAFEQQGATVERSSRRCAVQQQPLDCTAARVRFPGKVAQTVLVAFGNLQGHAVRFICDIVPHREPLTLPSPCSRVLSLKPSPER